LSFYNFFNLIDFQVCAVRRCKKTAKTSAYMKMFFKLFHARKITAFHFEQQLEQNIIPALIPVDRSIILFQR
jgi:hypothetical protein